MHYPTSTLLLDPPPPLKKQGKKEKKESGLLKPKITNLQLTLVK